MSIRGFTAGRVGFEPHARTGLASPPPRTIEQGEISGRRAECETAEDAARGIGRTGNVSNGVRLMVRGLRERTNDVDGHQCAAG